MYCLPSGFKVASYAWALSLGHKKFNEHSAGPYMNVCILFAAERSHGPPCKCLARKSKNPQKIPFQLFLVTQSPIM
jgi:hypothetical protein